MSKTYCLRFDTGNAAFEDYGRDYEVAQVIKQAATKIDINNIDIQFKVFDSNGNSIGRFAEVEGELAPPAVGEVVLSIETGNAAFDDDAGHEAARIMVKAAGRIANGDWPSGLLDINGNHVGGIQDNPPAPELPDDVVYVTADSIRTRAGGGARLMFSTSAAEIEALSAELDLREFGQSWKSVAIERDEDDDFVSAWVSQTQEPADNRKEFVQVMRNGMPEDWAEEYEQSLRGLSTKLRR